MRVCRVHGGKTPRGIASPNYKTGRYSNVLPSRLAARYAEAQTDPSLLELREDISLIDARLTDLLTRIDSGESGAIWQSLLTARTDLLTARRSGDTSGQADALNAILDLISKGHTDYRAWFEIGQVLEQRRRLVESERKRLIEAQQVVTVEQAMILVDSLLRSIREHVNDRTALAAIQAEFIRLTTREDQRIINV